jgi:hypothetical protein
MACLTVANRMEYCLRHGYSFIADNKPYAEAVAGVAAMVPLFDIYDMVWTLDADAVITNMTQRVEELSCLGPHVTVCEEGIVPWNRLNCGSIVWRDTLETRWLLESITVQRKQWMSLPCIWQTWLAHRAAEFGDVLTMAPLRSFNSCEWNRPGGGDGPPGSHWKPGDFVRHPCGVFPPEEKLRRVAHALLEVTR